LLAVHHLGRDLPVGSNQVRDGNPSRVEELDQWAFGPLTVEDLSPRKASFLQGLLKLLAVLVDRYADDDKSTIVELRMEFLEQGKLPRTDASPGCPEMEQDNLAADPVARAKAAVARVSTSLFVSRMYFAFRLR